MKKGFTLAEVLITLAIIGVVAALTIPSVIVNTQQQEFKTGLKKAVSVLNSAITMNKSLEGESPYDNGDLYNYLQQHMSVLKTGSYSTCYGSGGSVVKDTSSDCTDDNGESHGSVLNRTFYTTDGMRFETFDIGKAGRTDRLVLHESGIVLSDGNYKKYVDVRDGSVSDAEDYFSWARYNGYCGSYGLAKNPNETSTTPCVILVDVNGDRKPNPPMAFIAGNQNFEYEYAKVGDKKLKDIFLILITDEKAIPFGVVAQRAMYSK